MPLGIAPPPPSNLDKGVPQNTQAEKFGRLWKKRNQNKDQVKQLLIDAKESPRDIQFKLLKAASALRFCNETQLIKRTASGDQVLSTLNCGKKYCSICAGKKRNKLMFRYLDFFESEEGLKILEKYDLAMFTVTLQHNTTDLRTEPYYKELATHWRNGLKYGAFKKYFSGGFYNVEHTYTDNGHHIHRHALVLIDKKHFLYQNKNSIQNDLQAQWLKRTDGSFQIDLTPFHIEKTLKENLLEVTKYITKKSKGNVINSKIILAIDDNSREKFYHKFGILYKIKALNMNQINEEQNAEGETIKEKKGDKLIKSLMESKESFKLLICSGLTAKTIKISKTSKKTGKEYFIRVPVKTSFANENTTYLSPDLFYNFRTLVCNTAFKWRLEQMKRYDEKKFYDKWKEEKVSKERFKSKVVWRDAKQSILDF